LSGSILKQIREKEGLTQQQLADYIGKDRSLIAKIECEEASPSVETAKALGRALNVDWTIFFDDGGEVASHSNS
jgi:transcriptional regulator with XRE-family HTH domain